MVQKWAKMGSEMGPVWGPKWGPKWVLSEGGIKNVKNY